MVRIKRSLLAVLAITALTFSCVEPLEPVSPISNQVPTGDGLCFIPFIDGMSLVTKGYNINDEKAGSLHDESVIETLDIYVYWEKSETVTKFYEHYSFPNSSVTSLQSGKTLQLEPNWDISKTVEGETDPISYKGNSFRVYVIANLDPTTIKLEGQEEAFPAKPSEERLKSLISTSKTTYNVRYGNKCYDIVRLVNGEDPDFPTDPEAEDDLRWRNPHIKANTFLMDGVVFGWEPRKTGDAYDSQQFFNTKTEAGDDTDSNGNFIFNLSRAAAKFIVNLKLSESFIAELGDPVQGKVNTYSKKTTKDGVTTTVETKVGEAWYKYSNFAISTYLINPSDIGADDLIQLRENSRWDSQDAYRFSSIYNYTDQGVLSPSVNDSYPYQDITYSYAFGWDRAEAAEKAPAFGVSIIYTTTTTVTKTDQDPVVTVEEETDYYRIPLVNVTGANPATSVERNNCYIVNAEINSKGATTEDIIPTNVSLKYQVLPWPTTFDETSVEPIKLEYFVAEKEYRLRGDNTQWVRLPYFTPISDDLANMSKYKPTIVPNSVKVYYKKDANDTNGQNITNAQYGTGKTGVTIHFDHNEEEGGGEVYITSQALANRAVKYIEFDAQVTFTDGNTTHTITQHFTITHFPLDNIQSILGSWSSRSTSGWVSPGHPGTYHDHGYGGGYGYTAKIFYNGRIYYMDRNGNRGDLRTNTNNHMYVIQISKAEEGVILGRPKLNNYYQSDDNVVSPAFMIASELGAVRYLGFTGTNAAREAAQHCGTYREVGMTGRIYDNWRLPTKAEIEYIAYYQNPSNGIVNQGVFEYVLTGYWYYTLDDDKALSNYSGTNPTPETSYNGHTYVRCVRDLTPEEIVSLNDTGSIPANL